MTFKRDIGANATFESDRQLRKHSSPKNSIDAGTEKEVMCWYANARFWIVVTAGIAGIEERESIWRQDDRPDFTLLQERESIILNNK
jgi:hypothetical protein